MNGAEFEMFIWMANQNAVLNQQALLEALQVESGSLLGLTDPP